MPVRHSTLYKRFPTCQCVDFELKTHLKTQAKQELFYLVVQVDNLKLGELASCSRSHTQHTLDRFGGNLVPNYFAPNQAIFPGHHWP